MLWPWHFQLACRLAKVGKYVIKRNRAFMISLPCGPGMEGKTQRSKTTKMNSKTQTTDWGQPQPPGDGKIMTVIFHFRAFHTLLSPLPYLVQGWKWVFLITFLWWGHVFSLYEPQPGWMRHDQTSFPQTPVPGCLNLVRQWALRQACSQSRGLSCLPQLFIGGQKTRVSIRAMEIWPEGGCEIGTLWNVGVVSGG